MFSEAVLNVCPQRLSSTSVLKAARQTFRENIHKIIMFVLNVACPQCRLSSTSCPQRLVLNVACPQCPIVVLAALVGVIGVLVGLHGPMIGLPWCFIWHSGCFGCRTKCFGWRTSCFGWRISL